MSIWAKLTDLNDFEGIVSEMKKRYLDTILAITQDNTTVYARYAGYYGEFFRFYDVHSDRFDFSEDSDVVITIPDFPCGVYNTPNGVVHLSYNPLRRWRRGINPDRVILRELNNQNRGSLKNQYTFSDLFYMVAEQRPTFTVEEALGLAEVIGSVAVTRHFSVILCNHLPDKIDLMYDQYQIGYINEKEILLTNPLFLQEVLDTQRLWCPNHSVSCVHEN